jgi:hypothetical protein
MIFIYIGGWCAAGFSGAMCLYMVGEAVRRINKICPFFLGFGCAPIAVFPPRVVRGPGRFSRFQPEVFE